LNRSSFEGSRIGKNAIRIAVDAGPATVYDLVSVQLCIMAVRLKASTVDSP